MAVVGVLAGGVIAVAAALSVVRPMFWTGLVAGLVAGVLVTLAMRR